MSRFGLDGFRQINRLREVLAVLARYGFAELVQQLRLGRLLPSWARKSPERARGLTTAERVRRVCEELGPSFIKIGQILSTRPDLLPPDWIEELSTLQGRLPPIPFADIEQELRSAWGDEGWHRLGRFDRHPLATASIAQVHRGTLDTGEEVAVKVRRPGIQEQVEVDLRILKRLAQLASDYLTDLARHDPVRIAEEFSESFRAELDLTLEGRNLERFRENFRSRREVRFPEVYWEYTSETVLVTEFIGGSMALTPPETLDEQGYDRNRLARVGARAFLKMIIQDGFFHADPHPSNVIFPEPNLVCFIDCGMVGRLRSELREQILGLLLALIERNAEEAVDAFVSIGRAPSDLDREQLLRHAERFIDRYHGVRLENLQLGEILLDFVRLIREHHIALPPDLALLAKALITVEGLGQVLDPEFDMVSEAEPYLRAVLRARYRPDRLAMRLLGRVEAGGAETQAIYRDFRSGLRRLGQGTPIQFEFRQLRNLEQELDRASNRIAFALVVAALIIGSAQLVQAGAGPVVYGMPMFGLVGFGVAAFFGLWLIVAIFRSGRL
ncbi:ABC1 kinase family protein [Thiohalorhabdus sp. Cl-TMA]|uniref:ABC1 kinase family protein n=1 Tax=Thiohalorhabdus methylotrophus TaxID=3242694 RepID=A0ABV4TZQ0_9GAMM